MSRFEGLMVGTPPTLCTSPTLEINGTLGAAHPAASQADAYLFQVEISGLGRLQDSSPGEIRGDGAVLQDCL